MLSYKHPLKRTMTPLRVNVPRKNEGRATQFCGAILKSNPERALHNLESNNMVPRPRIELGTRGFSVRKGLFNKFVYYKHLREIARLFLIFILENIR